MKKFILGVLLLTIGSFAIAEDGPGNSGHSKEIKCEFDHTIDAGDFKGSVNITGEFGPGKKNQADINITSPFNLQSINKQLLLTSFNAKDVKEVLEGHLTKDIFAASGVDKNKVAAIDFYEMQSQEKGAEYDYTLSVYKDVNGAILGKVLAYMHDDFTLVKVVCDK